MICLYWKHADYVTVHTSMVDFVADYQDVIDNRGLEVWWQDEATGPGYVFFTDLV